MDAALPNDPGATLTHVLPKRKPGNMAPRPHGPDAARQDAPGRAQCGISQIRIICRRRSGARPEGPRARNPVTTSGGLLDSGFATSWRPGMTSFLESLRSPCRLRWLAFARRPRDRAARHRNPARPGEAAMQDVPTKATARPFKWVGTRPVRPDGVPKVTGRALYGADLAMPGMLVGRILRSPHAHARIRSIDTSKAAALPGVKAVVTAADLPEQKFEYVGPERVAQNFWHMTRNIMAREKALYEGHAVAAVAAISKVIAEEALALIKVDYEVLPHVIDVDDAMKPDAPLLFDDMITRGIDPPPKKPSNISKRTEYKLGDPDAAFKTADEVVEMSFKTAPVHQGYIEPQACVARYDADGQSELWSSSQGHFVVRSYTTQLLGMQMGDLRVYAAEIGGAFGGKTVVYVEPVAVALSKKAGAPVRVVMSREEVFKGSGPTSGSAMWVKIGVKRDGTIVAADCELKYQAGAFPGSPVMNGCMCAYAPYDLKNARAVGYDVVC